MRRVVHQALPFSSSIVTTASDEVIQSLAEHLIRGEIAAASETLASAPPGLKLEPGRISSASSSTLRAPRFSVVLTDAIAHALGLALRSLSEPGTMQEVRLSDLAGDLAQSSEQDWVVRCQPGREDPIREYEGGAFGVMWDAVLFHPVPRPAELERAWQIIQRWGDGQHERGQCCTCYTRAGSAKHAPPRLHSRSSLEMRRHGR